MGLRPPLCPTRCHGCPSLSGSSVRRLAGHDDTSVPPKLLRNGWPKICPEFAEMFHAQTNPLSTEPYSGQPKPAITGEVRVIASVTASNSRLSWSSSRYLSDRERSLGRVTRGGDGVLMEDGDEAPDDGPSTDDEAWFCRWNLRIT